MVLSTYWAVPLPDTQVLDRGIYMTANAARLAAGVEPVHRYQGLAVPAALVLQLTDQFTPAGIHDGFGHVMILHHVLRGQILHTDDIVAPDKARGQLVEVIKPLVGNVLLETCYLQAGLLPALAVLCLSGQLALERSEALLGPPQVLAGFDGLSIRSGNQCFQPKVDTNRRTCGGQLFDIGVRAANTHKVFAASGFGHGGGQDSSLHWSRYLALHPACLRELDGCVRHLDVLLGVIRRLGALLALELRSAGFPALRQSSEEVPIGGVQVLDRRLQRNRVHLFEPGVGGLESREPLYHLFPAERLPGILVEHHPGRQRVVVHEPAAAKGFLK